MSWTLYERFTGDVCLNCYHWSHSKTLSSTATSFHPSTNMTVCERRTTMNVLFKIWRCLSTTDVSNRLDTVCTTLVSFLERFTSLYYTKELSTHNMSLESTLGAANDDAIFTAQTGRRPGNTIIHNINLVINNTYGPFVMGVGWLVIGVADCYIRSIITT